MSRYKDLNSNFLIVDEDHKAIENAIKNLILVRRFEMPGIPKFGSNVTSLLFEEPSLQVTEMLSFEVKTLLDFYEPRINVAKVKINFENNKMLCTVFYKILESFDNKTLSTRLRLR